MNEGRVVSVNISDKKGMRKESVDKIELKNEYGIEGDAHASSEWHRQISLLALESIRKMQLLGLDVHPGDFAENITTQGMELTGFPVGTRLTIGETVEIEISQIGKVCHDRCAIYYQAGDCVMPKEGVFAKVIMGGTIKQGDIIKIKKLSGTG
jgi:MOSC domain-containing protein YiiM